MNEEPLQIRVLSQKNGVCDLQVQVSAPAVQATFDRIFHEAVARAQSDDDLRKRFQIPDDQPMDPEAVFAACGERVHVSMQRSLVDWALLVARDQLGLTFADQPLATVPRLEPGKPAMLRLRCLPVPEVPLSILAGLVIDIQTAEPSEAEVDATLQQMRRAAASMAGADANRPAQPGDRLLVDLRADLDGSTSVFDKVLIDLDLAHEPPDLVEHLTGATGGAELTFQLGDNIPVQATVHGVFEVSLPAVDDTLAEHYGLPSARNLQIFARESSRERLAVAEDNRILARIADHVCEQLDVPVPEVLARRRYALELRRALVERARAGLPHPEMELEGVERGFALARPEVEKLERRALVMASLAHGLGLETSDDELAAWISKRALRFGFDVEKDTPIQVRPHQLEALRHRLLQIRLIEAVRTGS